MTANYVLSAFVLSTRRNSILPPRLACVSCVLCTGDYAQELSCDFTHWQTTAFEIGFPALCGRSLAYLLSPRQTAATLTEIHSCRFATAMNDISCKSCLDKPRSLSGVFWSQTLELRGDDGVCKRFRTCRSRDGPRTAPHATLSYCTSYSTCSQCL